MKNLFGLLFFGLFILAGCGNTATDNSELPEEKEEEEVLSNDTESVPSETETVSKLTIEEPVVEEEPVEVIEEEPVEIVEEEPTYTETYSEPDLNLSTANGYDWVLMTDSQKYTMASEALYNLESNGITSLEGPYWFIDSLNAFYGVDETNSTLVTEIMVLSGFAGQVFIEQ